MTDLFAPNLADAWNDRAESVRLGIGDMRLWPTAEQLVDWLEEVLITRRRTTFSTPTTAPTAVTSRTTRYLIALVDTPTTRDPRLAAILRESARRDLGIIGVLLDDHPDPRACHVDSDGNLTITANGPTLLDGARASTLPPQHLADLLHQLTDTPVSAEQQDGAVQTNIPACPAFPRTPDLAGDQSSQHPRPAGNDSAQDQASKAAGSHSPSRSAPPLSTQLTTNATQKEAHHDHDLDVISAELPDLPIKAPPPVLRSTTSPDIDRPSMAKTTPSNVAAQIVAPTPLSNPSGTASTLEHDATATDERPSADPPTALRLRVLGRLDVRDTTGEPVFVTGKAAELLVLLAVYPDGVRLGDLLTTLWPDHPRNSARNNLSTLLRRTRRQLSTPASGCGDDAAAGTGIVHSELGYRLDSQLWAVDLWEIHRLLADAAASTNNADAANRALQLYRGRLDTGDTSPEWLPELDQHLTSTLVGQFGRLAERYLAADHDLAAAIARTLIDVTPENESLYQLLLRAHAGKPAALRGVRDLLTARMNDLGVVPSRESIALADNLYADAANPVPTHR
ncbi:hypothetical protein [Fodinicola feengrottensis]|uniref:hypothetical protein n=1 Tax=Fodinicola feengrottensis TaxID=435914 RepID=UPI0013D358A9|nr:hypothetical protein [Fodinicola feengrottensis]